MNMMKKEMENMKNNANVACKDKKYNILNEKYTTWEL